MSFLDPQNPGIGGIDELTDAETLLVQQLAALGDPNADRILFWDDSAGSFAYLAVGSGLNLTGTTLTSTGSGANTALSNLAAVAINTDLILGSSDGGALGSGTKMWSDLFLASGAVINFNNGDVTITHSADTLTIAGGVVDFSSTPTRGGAAIYYVGGTDVAVTDGGTGLSAIAALSLLIANSANTYLALTPGAGNSIRINAGGTAWEAYTPSSGGGATVALDNLASVDNNTTLLPGSDDGAALGSTVKNFSDLFLASGALINFANSNVVLTHSSGILTMGTGEMRITTPGTNSASVVTVGGIQTLTSKTLTTPVINGLPTGTGVSANATVSTLASRDANGNTGIINVLEGYTTTATAAGTTTLTVASTFDQYFTGVTTQTVVMPVANTLTLGQAWWITNNSTGAITVNSSGGNAIFVIAGGTSAIITCILISGTSAASWSASYIGDSVASGKKLTVSNTLTLAGTDSTTMTFPSTSATIARTDAANAFTGASTTSGWVETSPTITTKISPTSDDGAPLGDTTHNFSDLFLASGGVVNYANGDVVLTHTSGILTLGTGTLKITTPTNTATSVATIDGTQTFTNKSMSEAQLTFTDITTGDASITKHGFMKKLPNTATTYYDGTGAFSTPPGGNILATYTAECDVTAGMPVGISNLLDSKVSKALYTFINQAHGITTPVITGNQSIACPIGGDKFVYLQYTAATSDTLFAQVLSINRSTLVVTVGTALAVATAFTPGASVIACCKLDTDKFIVFYMADASVTNIQYRIGTVSGTTITFGTAATFVTAASTMAGGQMGADFLSTDKGVMFFKAATTTNSRFVAFTASGTVATAGTPVVPGTNSRAADVSFIKKIGTDKFVLATKANTNSLYGQVGTCSGGTTITLGSELQLSTITSDIRANAFTVVSQATDAFAVSFSKDGDEQNLIACTVSTTTITAGTALLMPITISNNGSCACYARSATQIDLIFLGNSNQHGYAYSLSGTTLTAIGLSYFGSTVPSPDIFVAMDNGYWAYTSLQDSSNVKVNWQGLSQNFIGIAQSTQSRGASVSVLLSGVDTNQTNMQSGAYYQVSNGALAAVDQSGTPPTGIQGMEKVKALSLTSVLVT